MMNRPCRTRLHLLRTSAVFLVLSGVAVSANAAFDPNAGAEPVASSTLPDTKVLYAPKPYMPKLAPVPTASSYASPVPAIQMPPQPLYPARAETAPAPAFPPVDPAVAAQAQQELQAQSTGVVPAAGLSAATISPAPASTGFIAPAPLLAASPAPAAAPSIVPAPAAVPISYAPAAIAAAPAPEGLSDQTKTILSHIPSKLDAATPKGGKVAINRINPDVQSKMGHDSKVEAYEAVGLSIKVRRPGLDTNFELNRAYTALMGGETETAISIYKEILGSEPNNEDALFGLAATYHRLGDIDHARPLYGQLLKINPNHREGLNNFLALVSDESPQEALAELGRLEERNPRFSPIPAQEAIVLEKLGFIVEAREKMLRAIDLAPDNLTYKYNLAIMLDRQGSYADASALYRLLIDASLKGEKIPTTTAALQSRLNFITTAQTQAPATAVN